MTIFLYYNKVQVLFVFDVFYVFWSTHVIVMLPMQNKKTGPCITLSCLLVIIVKLQRVREPNPEIQ
jgi:hypothetical protein